MDVRESPTHAKDTFRSFGELRNGGIYSDFTLKIGEEEIPVHRFVLAACSKYFDTMFRNRMKESKSAFAEILGIEPSAGKQCLEYMYTGKVKFFRQNPRNLIHAAALMQLHGLLDLYFEYLVENISPDNCLEYMELAITYNQTSFANIFGEFVCENFGRITETEGFQTMNQTLLSQCLECLTEESQSSENQKFHAINLWVNADIENRKETFQDLFKLIKLENFSSKFLKESIAKEILVDMNHQCKLRVYEALMKNDGSSNDCDSKQDCSTHILAYRSESRLIEKYNLKTKAWSRSVRVPDSIATKNTNVFSHRGGTYLASASGLTKFTAGSWSEILKTGFYDDFCQITTRGNMIYLVTQTCHFQYDTSTKSAVKYDIPSKLRLGKGFAIAASDDFLYAMGGTKTSRKAIEFAFSSHSWQPISKMNIRRRYGAAVFHNGKLVAVGGKYPKEGYTVSAEYYEPFLDKWTSLLDLPRTTRFFGGCHFGIFVDEGRLYALQRNSTSVETFTVDFRKTANA